MDKFAAWVSENPVVSAWITIISLIGVIITVIALILQVKDKKRKAIYYMITSNIILEKKVSQIEGVEVRFKGEDVNNIVASSIKFWNGGNESLEESDFFPEKELCIIIPSGEKILSASITGESEDTCKIEVHINEERPNVARVTFYYLEPKQGATIKVYHTNTDEKETKFIGKIKTGKLINRTYELSLDHGEPYLFNGRYRIYFGGGIIGLGSAFKRIWGNVFDIFIRKE